MPKAPKKATVFQLIYSALYILLLPFLILLFSGDWLWAEGWILSIWYLTLCTVVMVYLYRHDPGLLAERYKKPGTGGEKGWDRYWLIGMMATQLAWIIVMPLDAKRYGWSSPLPLWLKVIGGAGLLACAFLMYRSYTDNTYLSPLVRIQKDRKQKVVSTGVYGFVRHPMYLGGILFDLGAPLLLGSLWGLGLGLGAALILAGRIVGEEKTLIRGLKGYTAYQKKVRYRLIPGVW